MKKINLIFGLFILLGLSACQMKTKILDVAAISMTHTSLKAGESLKETGPVSGEFCPENSFGSKKIGLIDEVVKSTQTKFNVDFITSASIYRDQNYCVFLDGTGQKLVSSNTAPTTSKAPAANKQ